MQYREESTPKGKLFCINCLGELELAESRGDDGKPEGLFVICNTESTFDKLPTEIYFARKDMELVRSQISVNDSGEFNVITQ